MTGTRAERGGRARTRPLAALVAVAIVVAMLPVVANSPARAAGPTSVSGTISSDTTWARADSPFVVTSTVTVATGKTLTIEPGVVVKFNAGQSLGVNGQLLAEGTASRRIVFTSSKDDEIAGDTNGDGAATTPAPGDWSRLLFQSSSATSKIDYALIRFGGPTPSSTACDLGSTVEVQAAGRLEMSKSMIERSKNAGVKVFDPLTTGLAKFNHNVFGEMPCGGYFRDGELTENLFLGPFTSSDRAFYAYEPDGMVVHYNTFFGQPAWNDSNDVDREAADVRFNVFLLGVRGEATGGQNLANLQENYWGRVLENPPAGCWLAYPPFPATTYTSNGLCPPDYRGVTGYVHNILPAQDSPSPETVYAQLEAVQARGSGDGRHGRNPTRLDGDPVNTATGTYTSSVIDARVAGIGPDLELSRFYNSDDTYDGLFGPGWSFSYGVRVDVDDNDAVVTTEDGQQLSFSRPTGSDPWEGSTGVLDTLDDITGGYRLTRQDQVSYEFDEDGRLVSLRDRNDQGADLTYASGRLSAIELSGRTVDVTTNATSGHIERLTLPDDRYVEFTYTADLLTEVQDLRGNTTEYTYDAGERLETIVDQRGNPIVANVYDATSGRVTEQRDARNDLTTFGWDPATGIATVTDANSHTRSYRYVNNVLVTETDAAGATRFYAYDHDLNPIGAVSPRGFTTRMRYDARNNLAYLRRPNGATELWAYSATNDVTAYIDAKSQTTTYTYDANGNPDTVVQPAADISGPLTTDLDFDLATGELIEITDPRGTTTAYDYDTLGDLTTETSPLGNVTTFEYDDTGRLVAVVDPRGNASGGTPTDYRTAIAYNEADQRTSITTPLGNATASSYDEAGNVTSVTDARDMTTSYAYDDDNHLLTVTAPDTTTTTYTWDGPGNLTSRTDANSHQTNYGFDVADRLASITPPSPLGATTYTYDLAGNRATMTQSGSLTTNYSYDSVDRLTKVNWPGSTPDVTYEYDGNDNRTKMIDANGTETRAYDAINRLTTITRGSDVLTYGYDKASNITKRTYPSSIGSTVVDYTYDDDSRLASLVSGGDTVTYAYDEADHLTATELPSGNGYTEQRTWDRDGRVTDIRSTNGVDTIAQSTYTLDEAGNPLAVETADPTLDPTTSYTYDDRNRLTRVCYGTTTCDSSVTDSVAWTYDAMSNRTSEATPLGTVHAAFNDADQLCWTGASSGACGSPPSGATTYQYDNRGNTTAAGPTRLTYDNANRVASHLARASGINYSTTVLPETPLGYWRLGETSGTTAADSSGNSNTGTYVGNPTKNGALVVDHDSDKSVVFDSVDDAVTIPALPIANTSFTIEAWIRTNTSSPPADQTIFGAFGSTSAGEALAVRLLSDGTLRLSYGGADLDTPAGTVPFSSGNRHVIVTYDADTDTSRIYFDGVLRATGNQGPFTSTTATANIAYNGDATTPSRFKGHIDEAAVYGRALTADEVSGHFQSGKPATTYNYDGDDKRYRATLNGVQTNYTWDPNNPYPQLLAERSGSTLLRRYTYDGEPLSITNASGAKSWYHQDKLGSTLAVTSSSGTLQQALDYEPYGSTRRDLDDAMTGNPMRYTGQYLDPTGLYHLRARQYDPSLGVFSGQDPMSREITDPMLGAYQYADGNPIRFSDPTGEDIFDDIEEEILEPVGEFVEENRHILVDVVIGTAGAACVASVYCGVAGLVVIAGGGAAAHSGADALFGQPVHHPATYLGRSIVSTVAGAACGGLVGRGCFFGAMLNSAPRGLLAGTGSYLARIAAAAVMADRWGLGRIMGDPGWDLSGIVGQAEK